MTKLFKLYKSEISMENLKLNILLIIMTVILSGCIYQDPKNSYLNKRINEMDYNEAQMAKSYYVENKRNDTAIKCLNHMIAKTDDAEKVTKNKIELIELYLAEKDLESHKNMLKNFKI